MVGTSTASDAYTLLCCGAAHDISADCVAISLSTDNRFGIILPCFPAEDRCDGEVDGCVVASSSTFCAKVRRTGRPVVVSTAREGDQAGPCSFMRAEEMQAYAGVPIIGYDGQPLGSFSAMSRLPRIWSAEDMARLSIWAARASHLLANERKTG